MGMFGGTSSDDADDDRDDSDKYISDAIEWAKEEGLYDDEDDEDD